VESFQCKIPFPCRSTETTKIKEEDGVFQPSSHTKSQTPLPREKQCSIFPPSSKDKKQSTPYNLPCIEEKRPKPSLFIRHINHGCSPAIIVTIIIVVIIAPFLYSLVSCLLLSLSLRNPVNPTTPMPGLAPVFARAPLLAPLAPAVVAPLPGVLEPPPAALLLCCSVALTTHCKCMRILLIAALTCSISSFER
jgi:hypothetical protein